MVHSPLEDVRPSGTSGRGGGCHQKIELGTRQIRVLLWFKYIQASFHAALLIWFMLVYVPPLMHLSKAVNYIQKYKRFLKVTESDTEISEINFL